MSKPNPIPEYKKLKKIKTPSYFYLIDDTKRSRPQLQVDLMRDFGNIVRLPHFSPCFAITHPDYVKHIFLTNQENYIKSDKSYQGLTEIIGEGIITNNGEKWHDQRINLAPLFQPHQFSQYVPTMIALTQDTRSRWETLAASKKSFNLTYEIMSLTLKISAKNFLSEDIDDEFVKQVISFSQTMNSYVGKGRYFLKFLPLPIHFRLKKEKKEIETTLLSFIQKRKTLTNAPPDLLTQLLQMRNKDNERLTEQQLLAELKNFLVASYETVAHALTWTWYNLIQHPEILQRVKEEISQHSSYTQSLPALPYTKAVIEESMRMYPPAWIITRRAQRSDVLDGYFIPAGTHLLVCPYAIHRHPDYWPEPEKFIPERFFEDNRKAIHRFSYIPFGAGPRTCIASHLALVEAQAILAGLLPYFDLHISNKKIKTQAFITLSIKNGLWVRAGIA